MTFAMGTPLLDGCVLAILDQEDTYGYALTQRVKGVLDISESTLYPVLRRLQKEGCLTVYDQPYQGRNRRYLRHHPTPESGGWPRPGGEWQMFRDSVGELTFEGGDE